jgi:phosphohistidine phosphatase
MKTLLLFRHAKSSWKDDSLADHERPLNKRGKKAAPTMGRLIKREGLVPDLILSSTALRARKTAEAVAKACKYEGPLELRDSLYLATAGELLLEAHSVEDERVARLMLVGHNPGMEDLVYMLSARRQPFPTAALAVFELQIDRWRDLELGVKARLDRVLRPRKQREGD